MTASEVYFSITVCGQPDTVHSGETVQQYLVRKGINPARVVVEINRRILPRDEYTSHSFKPGDQVEIVHFVGGGAK